MVKLFRFISVAFLCANVAFAQGGGDPPDATISVSLLEGATENAFSMPALQGSRIKCRTLLGAGKGDSFERVIPEGATSVNVQVRSELSPFKCKTIAREYGTTSLSVSVGTNATVNAEVRFFEFDGTLEITTVNRATEELIDDIPLKLSVSTDTRSTLPDGTLYAVDFRGKVDLEEGTARIPVVAGQIYKLSFKGTGSGGFQTGQPGQGSQPGQSQQPGGTGEGTVQPTPTPPPPPPGGGGGGPRSLTDTSSDYTGRAVIPAPGNKFYFIPDRIASVTVSSTETTSVTIPVEVADSTIAITLQGVDGTSIPGSAYAMSRGSSADGTFDIKVNGKFTKDQTVLIPLVSGRDYKVFAGPIKLPEEAVDVLRPQPITISPNSGDALSATFKMEAPNYTLTVTPTASDVDGDDVSTDFDHISCFAYNARGQYTFSSDQDDSLSVTLKLRVGEKKKRKRTITQAETWRVGCKAISDTTQDSQLFKGEVDFQTQKKATSGTVSVALVEVDTAYSEVGESFSPTDDEEILLPGGQASLELPAEAFGADASSAEFSIKTAQNIRNGNDAISLQAWDLTPTVDGEVKEEPEEDAHFCIAIDEESIAEYGASLEDVTMARYDNGEWITTDTTITGSEGAYFACGNLDHFSVWGTILSVAATYASYAPSGFAVKGRKRNSKNVYTFSWDAADDALASVISYTVKWAKVKNKNACDSLSAEDYTSEVVADGSTSLKKKLSKKFKKICAFIELTEDNQYSSDVLFKKSK